MQRTPWELRSNHTNHTSISNWFKGALSPGFLLFMVQLCQNHCLLPLSCKTMLLPNQQEKFQWNFSGKSYTVTITILLVIFQWIGRNFEKPGKFFQISIHFHPRHLWLHTGVFSVNAVLQSLAAKLDHYFKVLTDVLAVLSFLKWW